MKCKSFTAYLCTAEEYSDFPINLRYSFKIAETTLLGYRQQLTNAGKAGYILPDNPIEYLYNCLELSYKE